MSEPIFLGCTTPEQDDRLLESIRKVRDEMNYMPAKCGHLVPAVGAPGSLARRAVEGRHCSLPRCQSQLPEKFTDRECAAYVWMWSKPPWMVDMKDKSVRTGAGKRYASLIEFAKAHGWEG
jgi:hypothetical protein